MAMTTTKAVYTLVGRGLVVAIKDDDEDLHGKVGVRAQGSFYYITYFS